MKYSFVCLTCRKHFDKDIPIDDLHKDGCPQCPKCEGKTEKKFNVSIHIPKGFGD